MNTKLSRISRQLSLVLRHLPDSIGLSLDPAGWVFVGDLLEALSLTLSELEEIVAENPKKRFEFSRDRERIRACQGHTIPVDLGLEPQTPPEILYHGTSESLIKRIRETGLLPMARNHVHLSADKDTAWVVAKRRETPVLVEVLALEMFNLGKSFFCASNGVWLTQEVPPLFLGHWFHSNGGEFSIVQLQALSLNLPSPAVVSLYCRNLPLAEAELLCEVNGYPSRVTQVDDKYPIVTRDYRPDRINFVVKQGIVKDAYIG